MPVYTGPLLPAPVEEAIIRLGFEVRRVDHTTPIELGDLRVTLRARAWTPSSPTPRPSDLHVPLSHAECREGRRPLCCFQRGQGPTACGKREPRRHADPLLGHLQLAGEKASMKPPLQTAGTCSSAQSLVIATVTTTLVSA